MTVVYKENATFDLFSKHLFFDLCSELIRFPYDVKVWSYMNRVLSSAPFNLVIALKISSLKSIYVPFLNIFPAFLFYYWLFLFIYIHLCWSFTIKRFPQELSKSKQNNNYKENGGQNYSVCFKICEGYIMHVIA